MANKEPTISMALIQREYKMLVAKHGFRPLKRECDCVIKNDFQEGQAKLDKILQVFKFHD